MNISIQHLKKPIIDKNSEGIPRLSKLEKAYNELKEITIQQDGQNLHRQVNQLKMFHEQLQKTHSKVESDKKKCTEITNNLKVQINGLSGKINAFNKNNDKQKFQQKKKSQINKLREEYLKKCQQRVKIASELNIKKLTKLDLDDRKSISNQPFKWIMVALYGETQSKYYWPNFKEQALVLDKGQDLKERLGKISAAKLREQQKIKTEQFLKDYSNISKGQQLSNSKEQIELIRKIAELFMQSYDIGKKVSQIEKQIAKFKQQTIEQDEQFMKWNARFEALTDRVELNKKYYETLDNLSKKLSQRIVTYQSKITQVEDVVEQLAKASKYQPAIMIGQDIGKGCCSFDF